MLMGDVKKHAGGNEIFTTTLDNGLSVSQKVKHKITKYRHKRIEHICPHKDTFIVTLLIMSQN